jgi:hypothetical protein
MKKNMGLTDRTIRVIVAAIIIVLYLIGIFTGKLGVVALVVVTVLFLTSLISVCPLYVPFGISTCKRNNK